MANLARPPGRLLQLALAILIAATVGLFAAPATPASAATGGCKASGCVGLDPMGRCDGDAYTVRSIAIITDNGYAGQLDLRYSKSCVANWGRFTVSHNLGKFVASFVGPVPLYGRVTVWNPGKPSQQPAQANILSWAFSGEYTTWSKMVDGTGLACTGVEPFYHDLTNQSGPVGPNYGNGGIESKGWFWGPCA
jgi:hypothetical protein